MGIMDKYKNARTKVGDFNKKHNVSGNFTKFMDTGSRTFKAGQSYDDRLEKRLRDL
jgi:hypothetical protein